jgi:hypothetical protein
MSKIPSSTVNVTGLLLAKKFFHIQLVPLLFQANWHIIKAHSIPTTLANESSSARSVDNLRKNSLISTISLID